MSKEQNKSRRKQRLWRGLTALTAALLALALTGSTIVDGFRTDIAKILGTARTRVATATTDSSEI